MFVLGLLRSPFFQSLWQSALSRCFGLWRRLVGLLGRETPPSLTLGSPRVRAKSSRPTSSPHRLSDFTYLPIPGSWERPRRPQLPESAFEVPAEAPPGTIYYVTKGELLGFGTTAHIEKLPSGHVIKTPIPNPYQPREEERRRQDLRTEAEIYTRLGNDCPYVPRKVAWDEQTCCLTLAFLENGSLEMYMQGKRSLADVGSPTRPPDLSPDTRRRWTLQAAAALQAIHAVGVVHCDFVPRNLLLDAELNLHISDFAGSSLDGSAPSVACGPRFQPPHWSFDRPALATDDIFALGSVLYFIMTGREPYAHRSDDEVERLHSAHLFADLDGIACAPVILACWQGRLTTAADVLDALIAVYSEDEWDDVIYP